MWLIHQLDPDSAAYHNVLVVRFEGALDHGVLERAFNEVISRHEPLRASFATVDGTPTQLIATGLRLSIPVSGPAQSGPGGGFAAALRQAAQEAQRPFDLATGPPIRGLLLPLSADDHLLVVTVHHIASDGGSITIFMTELLALYAAFIQGRPSPLSELPVSFTEFVIAQRRRLSGDRLAAGIHYWKQRLSGAPALIELPADRPRPAARTGRGAVHPLDLHAELTDQVRRLGRQHRATLFMTVLAALQVLLHRTSKQRDILVGSPMTHRVRAELSGVIGYLANTIVLRTTFTGDVTFSELLRDVRNTAIEAYAHGDVPFENVVQAVAPRRALSHHPLFQVVLSFHETLGGPLHQERFSVPGSGLAVSFPRLDAGTSRLDLSLCVHESAGALGIDFEYATDLFEAATIARLAACFETLLRGIVEHPGERVSRLPLVPPAPRAGPRRRPGLGYAAVRDRVDRALAVLASPGPDGWALPREISPGIVAGTSEDLLALLALSGRPAIWPATMICVGEPALPGPWRRRLERAPGLTLISIHGPPWTAVAAAASPAGLAPGHDLGRRIGRAIPGQRAEVLDPLGQPVPHGVCGLLHGAHPDVAAAGDLVRRRPDGDLELTGTLGAHGEVDGVPVRPCLVEAALSQHPSVGEVAVAVSSAPGSQPRLAACVVSEPGTSPSVTELRQHLRAQLASYLVPTEIAIVRGLPRTGRARIDRARLPVGPADLPESTGEPTPGALALRALRRRQQGR